MAAFLADENFEDDVVAALIAFGHDAITARSAGLSNQLDPAVLAAATALGRIVLTHDHDYHKLHRSGVVHAGIVYASFDPDFAALAARIDAAVTAVSVSAGRLFRITRPNTPSAKTP